MDVKISTGLKLIDPGAVLSRPKLLNAIAQLGERLEQIYDPQEAVIIDRNLDTLATIMRNAGLYHDREMFECRILQFRSRWRLGQLLAKIERCQGKRTLSADLTKSSFRNYLNDLGLNRQAAVEAQRIGCTPERDLKKFIGSMNNRFDQDTSNIPTFNELLVFSRPYWYQKARKARHQQIADNCDINNQQGAFGPFPLIYADPPWRFATYSEKGLDRAPDQHYPTLTYEEIADFAVGGVKVRDFASRDATLLLWCTSSNLHFALNIMAAWGFEFKTSAVWVKNIGGTGLVFRNWHELLLYGTRGNMPGPQYQPPSVFNFPRGAHSAKPPEIRTEIDRMYPDFGASLKLELFCRGQIDGWTCHGFESGAA